MLAEEQRSALAPIIVGHIYLFDGQKCDELYPLGDRGVMLGAEESHGDTDRRDVRR